jgi:hypothetical protein
VATPRVEPAADPGYPVFGDVPRYRAAAIIVLSSVYAFQRERIL